MIEFNPFDVWYRPKDWAEFISQVEVENIGLDWSTEQNQYIFQIFHSPPGPARRNQRAGQSWAMHLHFGYFGRDGISMGDHAVDWGILDQTLDDF